MWQWFTESAKRTVLYAQQEAGRMGTKDVASEHLLIGLLRQVQEQREQVQEQRRQVWPPAPTDRVEAADVASLVIGELGLELDVVRAEVERQRPRPASMAEGDARLTPDAERVIDLSYKEARRFLPHIGTEHLLLGLMGEQGGLAGHILAQHGADLARARAYVNGPIRQEDVHAAGTSSGMSGFWKRLFRGGGEGTRG